MSGRARTARMTTKCGFPRPFQGCDNAARPSVQIPLAKEHAMTIKVGDRIPNTTLNYLKDGVQAINTDEIFKGKKVVLFSVPGAFTPTCSAKHLPGYVERFDEFKKKGVEVACIAVND